MYCVVEKSDLTKIFNNINLNLFMNKYEGTYDTICLMDEKQAKTYNDMLTNENLSVLKEIAKLQLLQNKASYTDMRYYNLINEM
jgi:hypothetical protein